MIIDALAGPATTGSTLNRAEASLVRQQGYIEHFRGKSSGYVRPRDYQGTLDERNAIVEEAPIADISHAEFIAVLNDAGVDRAVVYNEDFRGTIGVGLSTNSELAEFIAQSPDRLIGLGGVDPLFDNASDEVRRIAHEFGLKGIILSPFKHNLPMDDPRIARLLSVCESEGLVVYLHTGINWWIERSYDMSHPRYVDALARSFPDLKIVATHCAWPWVMDMMMVAWRHRNVYVDISTHRPKHLTIEASGWSPLLHYGSRMLADRVMFASTWTFLQLPIATLVEEVRQLPLPESVQDAWLGTNASRLFELD